MVPGKERLKGPVEIWFLSHGCKPACLESTRTIPPSSFSLSPANRSYLSPTLSHSSSFQ
ncbi:hypothetical protein YC2023_002601 [Brassica napus]